MSGNQILAHALEVANTHHLDDLGLALVFQPASQVLSAALLLLLECRDWSWDQGAGSTARKEGNPQTQVRPESMRVTPGLQGKTLPPSQEGGCLGTDAYMLFGGAVVLKPGQVYAVRVYF